MVHGSTVHDYRVARLRRSAMPKRVGFWVKTKRMPAFFKQQSVIIMALVGYFVLLSFPINANEMREGSDTSDTVLLAHFNDGPGDVVLDVSAAGRRMQREGKLIGNPVGTQGRFGGGLLLDGQNDAVDFGAYGNVFDVAPYKTVPAGSVAFWFSPARDIAGQSTVSIVVDCGQSPRFTLDAAGQLEASYVAEKWTGTNVHVLKSGIAEWKTGTWYSVLFTWNEKGHFLFVNETPMASDSLGCGILAAPMHVTVGASFNGTSWSSHFAGKVDELRITRPIADKAMTSEKLSSGVIKETRQCRGTITGHVVTYIVYYPPDRKDLPVFMHSYGGETERTGKVNERVAAYGIFSLLVRVTDCHGGYDLQDYKDAIDDVFQRYADRIDTANVAIIGASYGGAVVFGMAVHFPYLFSAVIPIFGVADFGYDEEQSWYPMILKNSPTWGPPGNMNRNIGNRVKYRETRYLVRNAIFGAKNNPYAHFEILHDAADGVGNPGVHVEQSRRYVAELNRLGYTNYCYKETPQGGFVYPKDKHWPGSAGKPIRYSHSFYSVNHRALYHFELYVLKPNLLSGTWKRPPFRKTGELFVPSFLEVPCFRFDLGSVENNCDEAADVTYDVSSPDNYSFQIVPRTELTKGKLRLMKLVPGTVYTVTCKRMDAKNALEGDALKTDSAGTLLCDLPAAAKGSKLILECVRK